MQSSTRPCFSRRPGVAVGACCAARRTWRCDGKLLSPERRRRAVMVLQDRFRVSQRRASRLAGQNRNTQRRPTPIADIEEGKLRSRIRELARRHGRWGRRLVYRRLRLDGWSVNHKRVQRIWREEGLQRGACRASGSALVPQAAQGSCLEPNIRITCGRSTSSSTRRWMDAD